MKRTAIAIVLTIVLLLIGIAIATYYAGEMNEVVVVRTYDEAAPYDSKVWIVDIDGVPWVRVARSDRSWGERLRNDPDVELVRDGLRTLRFAVIDTSPEARAKVDAAFAEKYGLVDWWYGEIVRSDPLPVRLEPVGQDAQP